MNKGLWHLRAAFATLAIAIVLTVVGLLQSAETRFEAQRLYRHRVVADRVFDEAEREISALLQHEATRPSAAYDSIDTDPERWGRFVVGYYTRGPSLRLVAADKLAPERAARIREAVRSAQPELDAGDREPLPATALALDDEPTPTRNLDVLRQLNRGVKVREHREQAVTRIFRVVEAGPELLVLERATETRREGIVLSVPELVATIQSWVLSAQGLDAVATLRAPVPLGGDDDAVIGRDAAAYLFAHRLAPPLDGRSVSLALSRLDDEDAGETLYALAGLLVAAAVLGLFAIYRMVAVQLAFAERRDNFVAAVTHELRTPLTSIRMYAEMLRDEMVDDDATRREYYAAITSESERLTRLINNVMEHGLLRRGQRVARLERLDAGEVVREVVDLMTPHAAEAGFALRVEIDEGIAPIQIDRDALKQVLFNVIDNALKYGRGERAEVSVHCHAAGPDGVTIVVRDHGPGLAEGQQATIFQPFFRGESELTRKHQGTGLGLSLARDLLDLMRGTIRVRASQPGLEVRIALPSG
jgi:signal transduction histidine kinase